MSDNSQSLVIQTCSYQTYDKTTGQYTACNKPVVSAEFPFCFKHLRNQHRVTRSGDRYQGDTMPHKLQTQYHDQLTDKFPTDLVPELAMVRSMLATRLQEITDTVDDTGQSRLTSADVATLAELIERIRRLCETQSKINPVKYITLDDMYLLIQQIVRIIRNNIPNEHAQYRDKIMQDIKRFCSDELETKALDDASIK